MGSFLAIPIAIGLTILRHCLYDDIDFVINRILVSGTRTASLALVYVGSVVLRSFFTPSSVRPLSLPSLLPWSSPCCSVHSGGFRA